MHPPSRTRRILKWTGAGLALVILAIWVASPWYIATIGFSKHTELGFWVGEIAVNTATFEQSGGLGKTFIGRHGWFGWGWDAPPIKITLNMPIGSHHVSSHVGMSYWFLFLLIAIPTAWLWHRATGGGSGPAAACGVATI